MTTALGFIGLGQMGAPMAERLLAPDITLHVHDARPEAMAAFTASGAIAHPSPAAVANHAAIVFACLPAIPISHAVADQVATGSAIRIYAEMSTIGRETIEAIAARLATKSIATVDAPVSGGPGGARAGSLALLAAGPPAARAAIEPWQLRMGRTVFAIGDRPGQAQVMKLVNNLLFSANLAAAIEGFAMGAKAGLDPDAMLAMINAGTGRSVPTERVMEEVVSGRFAFGAALSVIDKDMTLGLEEAASLGVPMWTIEQAARLWRLAALQGMGKSDLSTLARLVEAWSGTEIRRTQ